MKNAHALLSSQAAEQRHRDRFIDPRLTLEYQFSPQFNTYLSVGKYSQAQGIGELDPVLMAIQHNHRDGEFSKGVSSQAQVTPYYRKAESSQHILAGVHYNSEFAGLVRIEVYQKTYKNLRPRLEDVYQEPALDLPEMSLALSMTNAYARGVELSTEKQLSSSIAVWGSYTIAHAKDIDGRRTVPRAWDRQAVIKLGVNWRGFNKGLFFQVQNSYQEIGTQLSITDRDLKDSNLLPITIEGFNNENRGQAYRFNIGGYLKIPAASLSPLHLHKNNSYPNYRSVSINSSLSHDFRDRTSAKLAVVINF